MTGYRLSLQSFVQDLSGAGSQLYGGRWNSQGVPVLYAAESVALALLEILVGLTDRKVPDNFHLVQIELPPNARIDTIHIDQLPADWREFPSPLSLKKFGDDFARNKTAIALRVPSVIVPHEFNYRINPAHDLMRNVKIPSIEPFRFDARLLRSFDN